MARSPITQLIELFHGLTSDQQALFLDQVDPQPDEEEKPAKKARKATVVRKGQCAACDYLKAAPIHHDSKLVGYHVYQPTRSRRASGMAVALNKSPQQQRQSAGLCTYVSEDGDDPAACGEPGGSGIHDPAMGYRNYHPFAPPAQSAVGD
jgi:hypothetical protein